MHDFTAATIAARQSALYVLADDGPVVIDVERRCGVELTDAQYEHLNAALETLRHELGAAGTDHEIHEAMRIITDRAYQAKGRIEVDAK